MCVGNQGALVPANLLIDEILVVVLDVEFPLHVLDLGTLQEYMPFDSKHLSPCQLALPHQCNQLAGILELFPKPS